MSYLIKIEVKRKFNNWSIFVRPYFKSITNEQVRAVESKLNKRPRKRYDYENPIFVMDKLLFNHEVAFMT